MDWKVNDLIFGDEIEDKLNLEDVICNLVLILLWEITIHHLWFGIITIYITKFSNAMLTLLNMG